VQLRGAVVSPTESSKAHEWAGREAQRGVLTKWNPIQYQDKKIDLFGGRDALNAKVGHILEEAPGFVFHLAGQAEVNHDHGRLRWHFGRNGAAPVVTRMDVAVFKQGRICTLYAFLDKAPSD
jgi:hypothetical protein